MKDLPHYLNRLNRRVIRSAHREEIESQAYELEQYFTERKQTPRQMKKQAKERIKKEKNQRISSPKTSEEKNRLRASRAPTFNWAHMEPPPAKPSQKKHPRI